MSCDKPLLLNTQPCARQLSKQQQNKQVLFFTESESKSHLTDIGTYNEGCYARILFKTNSILTQNKLHMSLFSCFGDRKLLTEEIYRYMLYQ